MAAADPAQNTVSYPLAYCLNVHDASTWSAVMRALDEHVVAVKQLVAPNQAFPLSLHLGHQALSEAMTEPNRRRFSEWLTENNCFLAALNAFPYGRFQDVRVKEEVYRPNWTTPERLAYTRAALTFLAELLPSGISGTVTTVPGGWGRDWNGPRDDAPAKANLQRVAETCREIEAASGKVIRIAIEPEPDCVWELFDPRLDDLQPDIGWCLDTCHAAVEFRALDNLDWSRIGRVQLSAAIECDNTPAARAALAPFAEPHYLHQTRAALEGTIIGSWPDLTPALADLPKLPEQAIVRTHYHVPLTWPGSGPLRSTRDNLTPAFFQQARKVFCEVETYTYSVLPDALRPPSLAEAIAAELQWAAAR